MLLVSSALKSDCSGFCGLMSPSLGGDGLEDVRCVIGPISNDKVMVVAVVVRTDEDPIRRIWFRDRCDKGTAKEASTKIWSDEELCMGRHRSMGKLRSVLNIHWSVTNEAFFISLLVALTALFYRKISVTWSSGTQASQLSHEYAARRVE